MSNATNKGSKYMAGRKGADIAALIRADIKAATKMDGALKGCTVSVRYRTATHSKAIDIVVKATPENILNPERVAVMAKDPYVFCRLPRFTSAGLAILAEATRIANQFNRLDSDLQTDYFNDEFFLSVEFDYGLLGAQERALLTPAPVAVEGLPARAENDTHEAHPQFCACHECDAVGAA